MIYEIKLSLQPFISYQRYQDSVFMRGTLRIKSITLNFNTQIGVTPLRKGAVDILLRRVLRPNNK